MAIGLFFLLLFLLFLSSQLLTRSLTRLFQAVFRKQTIAIRLLAFLFFPGVVIHELSHALIAYVFFVPVGKMEFLPVVDGDHVKLGSVQIGKSDPIRRMLIGVAPVVIGVGLLVLLLYFFLPKNIGEATAHLWRSTALIYSLSVISNTMFSSRKDLEGTIEIIGAGILLAIILYVIGVRVPESVSAFLLSAHVQGTFQLGSLFVSIPLGIDIALIILIRLVV